MKLFQRIPKRSVAIALIPLSFVIIAWAADGFYVAMVWAGIFAFVYLAIKSSKYEEQHPRKRNNNAHSSNASFSSAYSFQSEKQKCPSCHNGRRRCPNSACRNGYLYQGGDQKSLSLRCPTCGGTGEVRCGVCNGTGYR